MLNSLLTDKLEQIWSFRVGQGWSIAAASLYFPAALILPSISRIRLDHLQMLQSLWTIFILEPKLHSPAAPHLLVSCTILKQLFCSFSKFYFFPVETVKAKHGESLLAAFEDKLAALTKFACCDFALRVIITAWNEQVARDIETLCKEKGISQHL